MDTANNSQTWKLWPAILEKWERDLTNFNH